MSALWVLYFYIYALIGWCGEVIYAALKLGRFVNRGFLNGCWCPIYGFGAIMILGSTQLYTGNALYIYALTALVGSVIELIAGFLLKLLFHQRWWDYSDMPFNIGGYICPLFSAAWGFVGLLLVYMVHPFVSVFVAPLSAKTVMWLSVLCTGVFLVDCVASVQTVVRLNVQLKHINGMAARLRKASDTIGEQVSQVGLYMAEAHWVQEGDQRLQALRLELEQRRAEHAQLKGEFARLLEKRHFGEKRLLNAYPKLRSTKYADEMESLRAGVRRWIQEAEDFLGLDDSKDDLKDEPKGNPMDDPKGN